MIALKTRQRIGSFAHAIELIDKRSLTCTKRKVSNKLTLIRSKSEGSKVWDCVEVMCRGRTMATITPDDIAMVKFNCYVVANDYSEAFGLNIVARGGTWYVVPAGMPFKYRATPTERLLWPHRAPLMPLDLKSNLFLKYETDRPVIVDNEKARAWRAHISNTFAQFRVRAMLGMYNNIDRMAYYGLSEVGGEMLYNALHKQDFETLAILATRQVRYETGWLRNDQPMTGTLLVKGLTARYNSQRDAVRTLAGVLTVEKKDGS